MPSNQGLTQTYLKGLIAELMDIGWQVGEVILAVSNKNHHTKDDGSPCAEADLRAHDFVTERLAQLPVQFAQISEEQEQQVTPDAGQPYWLIDPLDGTRSYLRGDPEYTVNIALVHYHQPIAGLIAVPAYAKVYAAAHGIGAWVQHSPQGEMKALACRKRRKNGVHTILTSRSHLKAEQQWLVEHEHSHGPFEVRSLSSALKLALVAEGQADYYVRSGPTHSWDQAAGQALIEVAGGRLLDLAGAPLDYRDPYALLPGFLAEAHPIPEVHGSC